MELKDYEWIDFSELYKFLDGYGIKEVEILPHDNRTDGEFQRAFESVTGERFICHANVYDAMSFSGLVEWAKRREKENGGWGPSKNS